MTRFNLRICAHMARTALILLIAALPAFADTAADPPNWSGFLMGSFLLGIIALPCLAIAAVVALVKHVKKPIPTPHPLWAWIILAACSMPLFVIVTRTDWSYLVFWPAIALTVLCWHIAERGQARAGLVLPNKLARLFGFAALAFMAWQTVQALYKAVVLAFLWYTPPDPGTPPFEREYDGTKYARPMTASYRLALWRFPDRASCIHAGANPATAEGLAHLDWERIALAEEAEVCLFRVISGLPNGMADFTAFAKAQGFSLSEDNFNPMNPYVEEDRSLRVTGYWSLRQDGPKFPTRGLGRIMAMVPYGMDVNATFSPDGHRLLFVGVSFQVL